MDSPLKQRKSRQRKKASGSVDSFIEPQISESKKYSPKKTKKIPEKIGIQNILVSIFLILLFCFASYFNTLYFQDLIYDDNRIMENKDILPETPWKQLLGNDFWGKSLMNPETHSQFRPVTVASFKLNNIIVRGS